MVFDDIEYFLHRAGDVQSVVHFVIELGVDKMQSDKASLVLRQGGFQPLGYQRQGLQPNGELGRIEFFNLPQQRVIDIQTLCMALQCKMNMITVNVM